MKFSNYKKSNISKKVIACVTSFVLAVTSLPLADVSSGLGAVVSKLVNIIQADAADNNGITEADTVGGVYTVKDEESLVKLFNSDPDMYDDITIEIVTTTPINDALIKSKVTKGLGSKDNPFKGKLKLGPSVSLDLTTNHALFDYLDDSAELCEMTLRRSYDSKEISPLLAEYVTHSADTAKGWNIVNGTVKNAETGEDCFADFAGVIGEMQENSKVKVTFKNKAENLTVGGSAVTSDNAGLICNKMNSGSELVVSVDTFSYDVKGAKSVGGLVGYMDSNSKLTVTSDYSNTGGSISGSQVGGLVGYATNAVISLDNKTKPLFSGELNGSDSAGGIVGTYYTSSDNSFDFADWSQISPAITSKGGSAGGFFGILYNTGDGTAFKITNSSNSELKLTYKSNNSVAVGGIVGSYNSAKLSNSLLIDGITVKIDKSGNTCGDFGGLLGSLQGKYYNDSSKNAYVKVNNCNITIDGSSMNFNGCLGGVAGWIHSGFFDISNITVSINKFNITNSSNGGAGLLGLFDPITGNIKRSGVLRLSGNIDLSKVYPNASGANRCQIVGVRNNALVYATAGCNITRNETVDMDDLGQWGQVIMLDNTDLTEDKSGLLYFDENAHTVSIITGNNISGTGVTLSSKADFARAALIAQIEPNNYVKLVKKISGTGATSTTFTRDALLKSTINVSSNIDMTDTGVTGLMRDNGDGNPFTGTISGGTDKKTITLDNNKVYYHTYLGLLAKANGATIRNLTIKGNINSAAYTSGNSGTYIGGVTACNMGELTVNSVNSQMTIEYGKNSGTNAQNKSYAGGYVGYTDGNGKIGFTDCDLNANITYNGSNSDASKYSNFYAGGFIGLSNYSSSGRNIEYTNCNISGDIKNTANNYNVSMGGLIGEILATDNQNGYNNIKLNNVKVNGLNVTANASTTKKYGDTSYYGNSGGLLGHGWYRTNVEFGTDSTNGLTVDNSNLTVNGNGAYMGGLVYAANGYWKLNQISIKDSTFKGSGNNKFGMLVNKMCRVDDKDDNAKYNAGENEALYLEWVHDGVYELSGNTLDISSPAVFDEFAAYSTNDGGEGANGQGVISIPAKSGTDYKVYMDGTNCNTYQNRTSITQTNPNTRYYYNLDDMRDKTNATNTERFMLWSVKQYAASNLQNYFNAGMPSNATIDLNGYSYYPVSITNGATISGNIFKFYNKEIEQSETVSGGDGVARYTYDSNNTHTQHYLMHHGLFLNVSSNVTLSNLTLSGNVGARTAGSGALICGIAAGSSTSNISVKLNGITLDSLYVNNQVNADVYPLLINNGGINLSMTVSGVKNSANYNMGGNEYAATSLIGNVSGTGINIGFSSIKLDARKNTVGVTSPLIGLGSIYGTDKSIFKNATLMQSFRFDNASSSASYNYTYDEDWTSSGTTDTHVGGVTYGYEVNNSVENKGKQNKYYGSDIFTDPEKANAASEYDFSNDFLPYVAQSPATKYGNNYHEINVNISRAFLTNGCGTYSDPYIVNADMLSVAASVIGGDVAEGWEVNYNASKAFCDGSDKHVKYTYKSGVFTDGSNTVDLAVMRKYLCEAYYQIDGNIVLGSDFTGLGGTTEEYGFRGVIYGNDNTITNESQNPLIKNSNGSVVKDVTIEVKNKVSLTGSSSDISKYKFDFSSADTYCPAYGAVMGKVFGGDNIIDNVSVEYDSTISVSGNQGYLVPVGGYIGVVLYGGVYFRHMSGKSGLTQSTLSGVVNNAKLYQNPYIGRVINGFAVEEGTSFGKSSLDNGEKNYRITQLDMNSNNKLSVSGTGKKAILSIPDAQSLFIFGAITNSGAGTMLTAIATSGTSESNAGYSDSYMVRRAMYTDIGNKTKETSDFELSKADLTKRGLTETSGTIMSDASKTPRIIAYNVNSANYLVLMQLGVDKKLPTISLSSSDSYDLSQTGFRGLGIVFTAIVNGNSISDQYINTINGNNKTVKLNMLLNTYSGSLDNYNLSKGFGFIPYIKNLNNVNNVTLSGTVTMAQKNTDGSVDYYNDNPTGGLLGASVSAISLDKIVLKDLTVTGSLITGGIVGKTSGGRLNAYNCTADDISVYGGAQVGGVVGKVLNGAYITGGDFVVDEIVTRGTGTENTLNSINQSYAAGGIVGFANNSSTNSTDVSGFKIRAKNSSDSYIGLDGKETTLGHHAGGIIGASQDAINVNNCDVSIDIYGNNAGGIIGRHWINDRKVNVNNCNYGAVTDGDTRKYKVEGYSDTGGLIAYCTAASEISNCSVKNAEILATPKNNYTWGLNVGGIIGHDYDTYNVSEDNNFRNILIQDVTVAVRSDSIQNANKNGIRIGGAVGYVSERCLGSVNGYNVLLNKVKVETEVGNGSIIKTGNVIGESKSKSLKFVGFSKQESSTCENDFGMVTDTSSDSYVIMADFNGECISSANSEKPTLAGDDMVDPASPWVTVNPSVTVGSSVLTGDGVNVGTANKILSSAADGKVYNSNNIKTYANDIKDNYSEKLSDIQTLTGNSDINNFNTLLIDDNSAVNITKLLTEYISVLTNRDMAKNDDERMTFDFGSSVKAVTINTYEYSNGALTSVDKSLSYNENSGYFSTISRKYDNESGKVKFTLIDVAYKDPTDPTGNSNSVFHLQIPVYVKRVLDYSFNSYIATGTDYNSADYSAKLVFEGFNEPVTTYFDYTYYRTADEWKDAINGGDNLMWNFDKSVYINDDSKKRILPDGTRFVLVDRNNADKAYSFIQSDTSSDSQGKIAFNNFNSISSGTDMFKPVNIGELLLQYADVTANIDENGTLVSCEKSNATCAATLGGKTQYFRPKTDSDGTLETYSVEVVAKQGATLDSDGRFSVSENYYLTIITPAQADNTAQKDFIRPDENLKGQLPTNYLTVNNPPESTMLLGNFISQNVEVTTLNSDLIDNTNDYIKSLITTDLTVNQELLATYKAYADAGQAEMYQAFKLSLVKYEESKGESTQIQAGSVTVNQTVKSGDRVLGTNSYSKILQQNEDYEYIPYDKSIIKYLVDNANSGLTISAEAILYYDSTSMISQFPERPDGTTDGVALKAVSNISYYKNNLENSSITKTSEETKSRYYREEMTEASLTYNVPKMITGQPKDAPYSQLGVNPSDESTQQYVVQAVGSYDIHEIANRAEANEIRFTIELQRKDSSGTYTTVNINDYLTDITLYDNTDNKVINTNGYYSVSYTGSDSYDVTTQFTIKTGSELEDSGYLYSNYKVILRAKLYKDGNELTGTQASDYIVYTNARIRTDFVN